MPSTRPLATFLSSWPNAPIVVSDGQFTPRLFSEWERHSRAFFSFKRVDPGDQVSTAAAGLSPIEIRNWYHSQAATLDQLPFTEFVERLRPIALVPGWEQRERNKLELLAQGDRSASDYYYDLLARNEVLSGTPYAMVPAEIRMHMNTRLNRELRVRVN